MQHLGMLAEAVSLAPCQDFSSHEFANAISHIVYIYITDFINFKH